MPEYGRHIQEMVETLLQLPTREERTRQAKAVIAVMGNINPLLRDTADINHKLWDHLFIMSDFELDVDSPYPLPSRADLRVVPHRLDYNQKEMKFKHYGKYVQRFIERIASENDTQKTSRQMEDVMKYMAVKSYEFNQDYPTRDSIIKDVEKLGYKIESCSGADESFQMNVKRSIPHKNVSSQKKRPFHSKPSRNR